MAAESGSRMERLVREWMISRYLMLREEYAVHLPQRDALTPLLKAEADLFEAISGKRDLVDGCRVMGIRMLGPDAAPAKGKAKGNFTRIKIDPAPVKRVRVRLDDEGLFK